MKNIDSIILDIQTIDGEEFIFLDTGLVIRLDFIISIDEIYLKDFK